MRGRRTVNPHQLDFDWQFDSASQVRIVEKLRSATAVVLLGCPSLMIGLESQNKKGLLIERNRTHLPTTNFQIEYADLRFIDTQNERRMKYDAAVIDAPWYPNDLLIWLNVASTLVSSGAPIFFVMWPEGTRPSAAAEHREIKLALETVGDLAEVGIVYYDMPMFEEASMLAAHRAAPRRHGILCSLTKRTEVPLRTPAIAESAARWERLTLGATQVAIKIFALDRESPDRFGFKQPPFVLRDTSRRNAVLSTINIWTSDNVVAELCDPIGVLTGVREGDGQYFRFLSGHLSLKYEPGRDVRGIEWVHQA